MSPAHSKSTRKTVNTVNQRALPENVQAIIERCTQAKLKDLVTRGIISVNADYIKAMRATEQVVRAEQTFIPRMDVYDNPKSPNFIATFELPGVRTADMNLSIKEGNLIIEGERRCPMIHCGAASEPPPKAAVDDGHGASSMQIDVPNVKAAVQELRYGRFHRAVPLPYGVQQSDISAQMFEGMLTVSWPRFVGTGSAIASAPETGAGDVSVLSATLVKTRV